MDGTIAEIRLFAGNFPPRNWAFCQGQILSISLNTALFSLLGTTYGGNGSTTFALPDLRGRSAFGTGQGPGLPNMILGEVAGSETGTLLVTNLPAHNHTLNGAAGLYQGGHAERAGTSGTPVNNYPGITGGVSAYSNTSDSNMAPYNNTLAVGLSGGSQPFSKRQPYLGINYIICLEGIYPSRN